MAYLEQPNPYSGNHLKRYTEYFYFSIILLLTTVLSISFIFSYKVYLDIRGGSIWLLPDN